jgi:hypothetical protein
MSPQKFFAIVRGIQFFFAISRLSPFVTAVAKK